MFGGIQRAGPTQLGSRKEEVGRTEGDKDTAFALISSTRLSGLMARKKDGRLHLCRTRETTSRREEHNHGNRGTRAIGRAFLLVAFLASA